MLTLKGLFINISGLFLPTGAIEFLEKLKYFQNSEFSSNEVIQVWREAFQKFKTKKGARSSIEALLKIVNNGYTPKKRTGKLICNLTENL